MIEACPHCDTADIWRTGKGFHGKDVAHQYKCGKGHTFDEPRERPKKHIGSTHGLAKKLENMDP